MSKKILIVDDSDIVLRLHSYILEGAGFQCISAENGFAAMEVLLRESFDLVITDINMPRMNGYELTRKIRSTEGYEHIPIIIISTEEEAKDKMKGMEAGANVYIVKPAQPENLITNVRMLLGD
ncbi:MAG: response regulator [Deltaproteobacteria bacterium]|nr:response regulator [Deltaproteobacteria bacterium]MBW1928318.1 response regulator [Deltaproteobacteria bacterium]MBW2026853.1 response regulator [Deltaproteobacteria bacterium]MBW2126833.1 response regulator [Deltaproteobacteria bacterium]RLB24252.1 MAG: response regulator [Deltaproteobacteria bacterium]